MYSLDLSDFEGEALSFSADIFQKKFTPNNKIPIETIKEIQVNELNTCPSVIKIRIQKGIPANGFTRIITALDQKINCEDNILNYYIEKGIVTRDNTIIIPLIIFNHFIKNKELIEQYISENNEENILVRTEHNVYTLWKREKDNFMPFALNTIILKKSKLSS